MPVPVFAARPSLGHLFPGVGGEWGLAVGAITLDTPNPGSGPTAWSRNGPQVMVAHLGRRGLGRLALSQLHCPTLPPLPTRGPSLSWVLPFSYLLLVGGSGPGALPETPRAHLPGKDTQARKEKTFVQVQVHAPHSFTEQTN